MAERHLSLAASFSSPASDLFAWHLKKSAIERMIPPWRKVSFLFPPGSPAIEGSRVGLRIPIGPFHLKWILEHKDYVPGVEFSDVQVQGPLKSYRHRHVVESAGDGSRLTDHITYDVTPSILSSYFEAELSRMFTWRHKILNDDLELFKRCPSSPQRILLSGASGLMGASLKILLENAGHEVVKLVRGREAGDNAIAWDPSSGTVRTSDFEQFDAVIHLAGKNIAGGLWTKSYKQELFLSRCRDTWLLSQVLSRLIRPPKTLIKASAVGFYGDRGQEVLTEKSARGRGFLPELCAKWEESTQAIEDRGCRVVHARFGVVLSAKGGMLAKLLLPFKLGLGGRIGSGEQIMSWVGIDDAVGALYHALVNEELSGAVNVVAPQALAQQNFAAQLAHRLHRPACIPVPAGLLRLLLKDMADEMLLASASVKPNKLISSGYRFRYPDLATALDFVM